MVTKYMFRYDLLNQTSSEWFEVIEKNLPEFKMQLLVSGYVLIHSNTLGPNHLNPYIDTRIEYWLILER